MRLVLALTALLATAAMAQDQSAEPNSTATAAAAPESKAAAETVAASPNPGGVKTLSGMSILGNEEAPKSLVIVPWKSSRLGDGLGIANSLDDSPHAVDKEVFLREVHFFDLRSGGSE